MRRDPQKTAILVFSYFDELSERAVGLIASQPRRVAVTKHRWVHIEVVALVPARLWKTLQPTELPTDPNRGEKAEIIRPRSSF